MVEPFNLTNLTNGDDIATIMVSIDQLSGGVFGALMLISVLVIMYFGMKASTNRPDKEILALVFWMGTMVSTMMLAMGLIPAYYLILVLLTAIAIVAFSYIKGDG